MSLASRLSHGHIMPLWRKLNLARPLAVTMAFSVTLPGVLPFFTGPVTSAYAAAPDFSKGFDLLFELGLPDVSGPQWQYVALEGQDSTSRDPFGGSNEVTGTEDLKKALSHGWLEKLPEGTPSSPAAVASSTTAGPGTVAHKDIQCLLIDGWQLLGIANDAAEWARVQQAGLGFSQLKPGKEAVDEKADAKALAMGLQAISNADERAKRSLFYNPNFLVSGLFRAAQHHRRGHKEEAAAVVQALFALVPRKDRLLDLAVQKLAEDRYRSAMLRFNSTGDWKAFDADLTQALNTFTRGWTERPLVEKLHGLVQKRLASPKAPALANASLLTPEQQAWWQQVSDPAPAKKAAPKEDKTEQKPTGAKEDSSQPQEEGEEGAQEEEDDESFSSKNVDLAQLAQVWLFNIKMMVEPSNLAMWKEHTSSAPGWMQDVLNKDWDWITVAAAAVGDETLVHLGDRRYYGGSSRSFDFESDPPEFSEEELQEQWQNLDRPRTRGDLARSFLDTVLPRNDEEGDEIPMDPAELRQVALDAAKALNGKAPLDTARFYLKNGTREQKSQAMVALINNGTDADIKGAETLILAMPSQNFEQATHIVRKRKADSKPFLEQFRKALLEEQARDQGNDPAAKVELPDYLKEQFTALEAMASGRGPAELLADYAGGKIQTSDLFRQLQTMIKSQEEGAQVVDSALEIVSRQPKGEATRKMQILMFTLNYAQELTDARKALLRKILEVDPDSPVVTHESTVIPLSDFVYWMADVTAHGEEIRPFFRRHQSLDSQELWPLWIARGRAVLEGTSVPPLPSAAKVPAERRQAMLQALDQHLDKGWPEYVQALSFDEKLALHEDLQKAGFKPAWRTQALRVIKIQADPANLATLDGVPALQGQPISAAALVKLAELCRAQFASLTEGQGIRCMIVPMGLHQGLRVFVATGSSEDENDYGAAMLVQAGKWMKQLRGNNPEPIAINGYSWARWMNGPRELGCANWHLDKDNKWQNWPENQHETLGTAPNNGTPVADADLLRSLEERINTWDSKSGPFWYETGVVKPGPAASETKGGEAQ